MTREEEMFKERLRKLAELRKQGVNPYPSSFKFNNYAAELLEKYKKLRPEETKKDKVSIAGRLIVVRSFGKINFGKIQDKSGEIQIVVEEKSAGKKAVDFFLRYVDSGDFIGVEGVMHRTKRGELSVLAKKIELLTKTLNPLPEKWHGLQEKEERYRKRYLDLIMNPDVKKVFEKRSSIIAALREFLIKRDFVEVDTPVLQPIPGGAAAKPFVTHYNAYDIDVYLRIAPELYLKRLLIGGFEKVFEFARCFRNEGVDWSHNPEFTDLEFYQSYVDYKELMKFTEDMILEVMKKVNGKAEIEREGKKIPIKKPFKKITFKELTKGKMTDEAFKEEIKKISAPTFVIDHPVEISPLSKENEKNKRTAQRFQLIIGGIEIVNAFSELNDPLEQEKRFLEQEKRRKKGEEGHRYDEEFISALKHGMPPAAGFGMGIDRFVLLLTGSNALREILLFPFMKPEK